MSDESFEVKASQSIQDRCKGYSGCSNKVTSRFHLNCSKRVQLLLQESIASNVMSITRAEEEEKIPSKDGDPEHETANVCTLEIQKP